MLPVSFSRQTFQSLLEPSRLDSFSAESVIIRAKIVPAIIFLNKNLIEGFGCSISSPPYKNKFARIYPLYMEGSVLVGYLIRPNEGTQVSVKPNRVVIRQTAPVDTLAEVEHKAYSKTLVECKTNQCLILMNNHRYDDEEAKK